MRIIDDLKMEIKALRVFLERHHLEIMKELPGSIKKFKSV